MSLAAAVVGATGAAKALLDPPLCQRTDARNGNCWVKSGELVGLWVQARHLGIKLLIVVTACGNAKSHRLGGFRMGLRHHAATSPSRTVPDFDPASNLLGCHSNNPARRSSTSSLVRASSTKISRSSRVRGKTGDDHTTAADAKLRASNARAVRQ